MVLQLEAARRRDRALALLDLGVEELLDPTAVDADEVVVVLALVQTRKTSSALLCRGAVFWKTSRTLMRGRVAFRPLFFSSSAWVMAVGRAGGRSEVRR